MTLALEAVGWRIAGRTVLDGVTLGAAPGEMLGLLGPNGSGKSSLLRIMAGLCRPSSGRATLDGDDLARLDRRDVARRVAVVAQHAATDAPVTVLDVVRLGRMPHRGRLSAWTAADAAAVERALESTDLTGRTQQRWSTLSGGERQRVQIARALAQTPRELLLDEPTNHLDIRHQLEILTLLARLRLTTVVALHDLNLAARFCDRVAVLAAGRLIAAGRPADVLTPALIHDVFEVDAAVETGTAGAQFRFTLPPGRAFGDHPQL